MCSQGVNDIAVGDAVRYIERRWRVYPHSVSIIIATLWRNLIPLSSCVLCYQPSFLLPLSVSFLGDRNDPLSGATMLVKELQKAIYRESFEAGVENFENYRPGGFHPVHIGDRFSNGRYVVINKLGAGSFATVWLVQDETEDKFRALKILTADESHVSDEVTMLQALIDSADKAKGLLLLPLDTFEHEGPNGRHVCIVTQVAGPNLWGRIDSCGPLDLGYAARASIGVCQGLAFMHRNGVGHGGKCPNVFCRFSPLNCTDLHTGNILMRISNWDELPKSAIQQYFEFSEREPMVRMDGQPLDAHAPKYAVAPVKIDGENVLLLDGSIYIADYGNSFKGSRSSTQIRTPKEVCAPEVLFDEPATLASDIWTLGNTLFEILSGIRFFEGVHPTHLISLQKIIKTLGDPPQPFLDKWSAWMNELRQDPAQNRLETEPDLNVADRARRYLTEDEIPEPLYQEEETALINLLEQIFVYEADRRPSAESVKEHPWLKLLEKHART